MKESKTVVRLGSISEMKFNAFISKILDQRNNVAREEKINKTAKSYIKFDMNKIHEIICPIDKKTAYDRRSAIIQRLFEINMPIIDLVEWVIIMLAGASAHHEHDRHKMANKIMSMYDDFRGSDKRLDDDEDGNNANIFFTG